MILVIGGYAAGKREWVSRQLGYPQAQMSDCAENKVPVFYGLESQAERFLKDPKPLLQKKVVICCEVGCGVVPLATDERARRESVGKLCQLLARQADCVVRVICGVGQPIKGAF